MPVALWSIKDAGPERLEQRREWVEAQLEGWVKRDASMVAEGLRWIGQQVRFPDGSRLDLLGMTPEGSIVLAELKRGVLGISTLAQALHYVLWLGSLDLDTLIARLHLAGEEATAVTDAIRPDGGLDVSVLLIGTGRAPELEKATAFLLSSGLSIPVSVVTFTPFVDGAGEVFLARQTEEQEPSSPRSTAGRTVEQVLEVAREENVHAVFETALTTAEDLDLRVKPWAKSITVVPPSTHGKTLIYLRPKASGRVRFGYHEENFSELYRADPSEVRAALGENWVELSEDDALSRIRGFMHLMQKLQADAAREDESPKFIPDTAGTGA